jgi:hypothetical protein
VTTCKSASAMLVSSPDLNVVATIDSVVVCAFGSILFDFFYYNPGSDYITKPCRKYYDGLVNKLGI